MIAPPLRLVVLLALLVGSSLPALAADPVPPKKAEGKSRTFQFIYKATVTGLEPGTSARIWLPIAASNDDQTVEVLSKDVPAGSTIGKDSYGNSLLHVEAKASKEGTIPLTVTYRIVRREVKGPSAVKEPAELLARYLQADRKVPIDGRPLDLLKGVAVPAAATDAGHVLYDIVEKHMKYDKTGTGWGNGDSVWACDNGHGNCTDFHSLFISLARSRKLPAKFEIGFALPPRRGAGDVAGYHCWAWFQAEGKGWIAVDISEASKHPELKDYYFGNLTEDRVVFSTGRDLELVPKQDGPPVNFLVYPYVEVGGKPWPADKVQRQFRFKDAEEK